MKRPLAYITAAWCGEDYKNTEQAARYCRAVYEAGFSPICPTLYLPLFLNARMVAQVLGVSISTAYELLNDPGFPTLRVGSRMVVPKEKFIQWAEGQSGGAK